MSRTDERTAKRIALSGIGPSGHHVLNSRWPGATGAFGLFGEVLLIGLLVFVVAVPVVTLPLALAAGTRHLRRYLLAEDSGLALFWRDVRAGLPGGLLVGLTALAAVGILALDLALASSGALPGGMIVGVAGWIGLAVVALGISVTARTWDPATGWKRAIRAARREMKADMVGMLYLLIACGFVVLVTWQLPPLLLPGLGVLVLAILAVPERRTADRR